MCRKTGSVTRQRELLELLHGGNVAELRAMFKGTGDPSEPAEGNSLQMKKANSLERKSIRAESGIPTATRKESLGKNANETDWNEARMGCVPDRDRTCEHDQRPVPVFGARCCVRTQIGARRHGASYSVC